MVCRRCCCMCNALVAMASRLHSMVFLRFMHLHIPASSGCRSATACHGLRRCTTVLVHCMDNCLCVSLLFLVTPLLLPRKLTLCLNGHCTASLMVCLLVDMLGCRLWMLFTVMVTVLSTYNCFQDFTRTATYQAAILQNGSDFMGKVGLSCILVMVCCSEYYR